ncbi:probable G-protein coupled receptor Mth-like 1 [Daktulosphaira vitifoliae]|uniref:probable G-protein coupled receptor Mth-like 1 n=1 Tax=Daktulosphaira vitifoliae TaxID=58002 RepID=UPI0021A9E12C|nr:probable G-protein coupled receptor Mth-like 1 [Daktulosphaira vitifoliae]
MPLFKLLLLTCVVAQTTAAARNNNVTVFRCCGPGETLDETDVNYRCVVNPSEPLDFVPIIFDHSSNQFLAPNTTPPMYFHMVQSRPPCQPAFLPAAPPGSPSSYVPFLNGSLWVHHLTNPMLDPGKFCVDRSGALFCVPDEPDAVKKCCSREFVYSEQERACVYADREDVQGLPADIMFGLPQCSELGLVGRLNETHWTSKDGPPGALRAPDGKVYTTKQYCLEHILEQPQHTLWTVIACAPQEDHVIKYHAEDTKFTLYPLGLLVSVFFLAVTLVASCMLPSTYHVLHWKCQVNHVGCLMVGDLFLAIVQLSGESLYRGPFCVFTAIVMHFVFLAAFFWLNTMCFNIWWTFRDLRPANLDKGQEACRFRLYQLYAWGVPFVIATLAAVIDRIPPDQYISLVRPKFGEHRCWFYGDADLLSYFYGPIGILLMMNLTLFAATARELTCGLWRTEVVKSTSERATLGRVCLKLVIVMGITWVVDVVSWIIGGPDYVWYMTDVMNALQGLLIFIVVGCQPQVWMAVKRMWCLSSDNPSDGGNARSSMSNAMPSTVNESTLSKPVETLC